MHNASRRGPVRTPHLDQQVLQVDAQAGTRQQALQRGHEIVRLRAFCGLDSGGCGHWRPTTRAGHGCWQGLRGRSGSSIRMYGSLSLGCAPYEGPQQCAANPAPLEQGVDAFIGLCNKGTWLIKIAVMQGAFKQWRAQTQSRGVSHETCTQDASAVTPSHSTSWRPPTLHSRRKPYPCAAAAAQGPRHAARSSPEAISAQHAQRAPAPHPPPPSAPPPAAAPAFRGWCAGRARRCPGGCAHCAPP